MTGPAWAAGAQPDEEVDVITREDAQSRAIEFWRTRTTDSIVLVEVLTKAYGWVFLFLGADHLASGDPNDELLGLCPVLVLAESGEVVPLGTAHSVATALREYERENGLGGSAGR